MLIKKFLYGIVDMRSTATDKPKGPEVKTTVDPISFGKSKQVLDHGIHIIIKKDAQVQSKDDVRFLQFITRQTPCQFEYLENGKVAWEEDMWFTSDPAKPRWKVDSGDKSNPFYESRGAFNETDSDLRIADQPELTNINERVVGTTFLFAKDTESGSFKVFKEVRWSRQNEIVSLGADPVTQYSIEEPIDCQELPDWALHTIQNKYDTNAFGSDYEMPAFLNVGRDLASPEDALRSAGKHLVPTPPNWVLKESPDFKELFEKLFPSASGITSVPNRTRSWVASAQPLGQSASTTGSASGPLQDAGGRIYPPSEKPTRRHSWVTAERPQAMSGSGQHASAGEVKDIDVSTLGKMS